MNITGRGHRRGQSVLRYPVLHRWFTYVNIAGLTIVILGHDACRQREALVQLLRTVNADAGEQEASSSSA